jgi:Amt family ammonium transporter
VVSVIILKVIDWTVGLRIEESSEVQGLDVTLHGEEGYFF